MATDPLDELAAAVAAEKRAQARRLKATLTALRAGKPQAAIARILGRSREHVRQLALEHDVPSSPRAEARRTHDPEP